MTKRNRMELGWGSGSFDVFIDLKTQELVSYASLGDAEQVHQEYGGQNFYRSHSGLSGKGWVRADLTVRPVHTYRVDSAHVQGPRLLGLEPTLPLVQIIAPIDYRASQIPEDWPILFIHHLQKYEGSDAFYDFMVMANRWHLKWLLRGQTEARELEDHTVSFSFYPSPHEELKTRDFQVGVFGKDLPKNARQALIGIFNHEMRFRPDEAEREEMERTSPFWTRLGLHQANFYFFKISSNVAWARYDREDLATVEALQEVAPKNVLVLAPNLYIQENGVSFEAVALFEIDGQEVEFEEVLTIPQAVQAFAGNYEEILRSLEAGARQKVALQQERERQWAAHQSVDDNLVELIALHGDREVTIADSVASGNCLPGTQAFARRYFHGRESVTVRELAEHLDKNERVRQVLMHVLQGVQAAALNIQTVTLATSNLDEWEGFEYEEDDEE